MISMLWKPTLPIANFVTAILALWLHVRKNGSERYAKDRGDGCLEFAPDPLALLVWPLIVVLPAWVAFNDLKQHASGEPWSELLLAITVFAAAAALFNLPGTVVVAHDGVEQHFWFRGEKRIRWGEIKEIKRIKASGSLIIYASDGTKISFTDLLADRPRFLTEVEMHAYDKLPPNLPDGSILGLQDKRKSG